MNAHFRMLPAFLAASMLFTSTAAAAAPPVRPLESPPPVVAAVSNRAAADGKGRIQATVRLDYDQNVKALEDREVKAVLTDSSGNKIKSINLWDKSEADWSRKAHNDVQLIDLFFEGLDAGDYTLTFSGEGYVTSEHSLTIEDHSQYISVGTGDKTFTIGDLNEDDNVDDKDLALIVNELQNEKPSGYDLNGDDEIDIIDLAYVNHNLYIDDEEIADIRNLELLTPPEGNVKTLDGTIIIGEDGKPKTVDIAELMDKDIISKLQREDGEEQISEATPVTAAIEFADDVEMSQINLLTTSGDGEIKDGIITLEYTDPDTNEEKTAEFPIENGELPDGVYLLSRAGDGIKEITIQLGKRVAVKKVTITVTRTESGEFASVAAIQFLQDIVPENPLPKNVAVRGLSADPGNAQIDLKWSALPNITGYEIVYYKNEEPDEKETMKVDITSATITGLDNGDPYVFEVTPISEGDGWRGKMVSITATPETTKKPDMVNMVSVTAGDSKLDVSWKEVKDADTYTVYYSTDDKVSNPTKISDLPTNSTSITGLTNDTAYYLYVTASNALGEGPKSNIVTGTPKEVSYEAPEGLPTEGLLDRSKIASIKLTDSGNVSADCGANFDPEYMIDGDYKTHWTAANWWRNEHVEVTFTEPVALSNALWVPRLDGNYPNWLRVYAVQVWYDNDDLSGKGRLIVPDPIGGGVDDGATGNSGCMKTWPSVRNNPSQTKFAVLPFGPVENVKKVSIAVEQAGYNLTSLSELMFMEYDEETDVPTNIRKLFANNTFTELAAGVDAAKIDAVEALLEQQRNYCLYPAIHEKEIALARALLTTGKTNGVLLNSINSLNTGHSTLQPLGASANAGDTIAVYADIPAGESVQLYATQVNAEASAWRAPLGTLTAGRNVITIPKIGSQAGASGGSLYYTYTGDKGSEIKIHILGATDIPSLDLLNWLHMSDADKNSAVDAYLTELQTYIGTLGSNTSESNPKNVTEISTPSVLLSIPASSVSGKNRDQILNTVQAWEQIMDICRTTQGYDIEQPSSDFAVRQNVRCMQMFAGAFMYAAGSHIGIGAGSCAGMVSGTPVPADGITSGGNGLFGWGIAHEIGHNMDLLGKAEITNNIYSIMVQTFDGKQNTLPSRLENSGKYPKAFQKVAQQTPGMSNDVFTQLAMYWQLHLAYDEGDKPMDFYNRFFQAWKSKDWGPAESPDERFAVVASKTAGKNLTEFFVRWGMTLSDSVKAELAKLGEEPRAIWYLNDQSRRDRLSGENAATGTISVTASVKEKDVTLTITPSITGKVQGYEIIRSGKSVDFVISDGKAPLEYVDTIGSANHKTFTYSVKAYDTLGNKIAEANSVPPEIRIAYDSTVPAEAYTLTEANGAVTFTAKNTTEGMQVSGVKLVGHGGEKETLTVTVTDINGKSHTPRQGETTNLAADTATDFVTYLQKPGAADPNDARIWTYDAKTVTVTLPAGVTAENVLLIDYPGDDVAFMENGAAIGKLKEAYGDIPADSIVVVGTFRGDPAYIYAKAVGEFTVTPNDDETGAAPEPVVRDVAGSSYIFSELHEGEEIGDISNGIFLFVLDVKAEQDLQKPLGTGEDAGSASICNGENLLPSRLKIELYRTDDANTTESQRKTAETLWIHSPGGTDLPYIILSNDEVTP